MEVGTLHRVKRRLRHLHPKHVVKTFITRRTMQQIAEKYGLVYFGTVDHHADEHKIIRGHTVSTTQQDNHYTVGSIQDYDIAIVQRNSLAQVADGRISRNHWVIVSISLHTRVELPRFYVCPQAGGQVFEASHTQLHPLTLGSTTAYSPKFTSNFTVYAQPSDAIDIEWLLHPATADVMQDYFANMPFEVENNMLYVYNENKHPGSAQIDKMLQNGIWLAQQIDAAAGAANSEEL